MQLASNYNIDKRYYHKNWSVHASLDKASNSKDFKIEESKPKIQEPKTSNLNNSLRLNLKRNIKTSNKAWKEKKKYRRWEKCDKKDSNPHTSTFRINTINNFGGTKCIQQDICQVTC